MSMRGPLPTRLYLGAVRSGALWRKRVQAQPRWPGRAIGPRRLRPLPEHHRSVRASDFEGIARQVPEFTTGAARLARTPSTRLSPASTAPRCNASGCCVRRRRRRPCRASRPGQVFRRRWITASTISTSPAKVGAACTSSAICLSYSRRQYLHFVESMGFADHLA